MSLLSIAQRALSGAAVIVEKASFLAPLLARLTVGYVFIESGWGKVHNLENVTAYFMELGIPAAAFQAVFVSYTELICGTLVLWGLLTRLAAVPLIGTMIVALITAKAEDISGVSDLVGTIEFLYVVLLSYLALAGPGSVALDQLAFGRLGARNPGLMARAAGLKAV